MSDTNNIGPGHPQPSGARSQQGPEGVVGERYVSDVAVVQTVARSFTLRDGQEALRIINQAFDPVGVNPGTGTGRPDLARAVKRGG